MQSKTLELKNQMVRAGAGAGKTTALTEKVLHLAQQFRVHRHRLPHFVVTTFTRKATQELRERLLKLATQRAATDQTQEELQNFVISPSHLHISTIHGILSLFLSRYGYHINMDPAFRVIDDGEAQTQIRKVVREHLISEEGFQALLEDFDFNRLCHFFADYFQRRMENPNLVFADEESIAQVARQQAEQWQKILAATAQAVREETQLEPWLRLARLLNDSESDLQKLSWEKARAAIEARFSGFRKPGQKKDQPILSEATNALVERSLKICREFEQPCWDSLSWPQYAELFAVFQAMADKLFHALLQEKLVSGQITMEDLQLLSLHLIRQHPSAATAFAREWDYWLVDEYQDTSPVQVSLLSALIGERPHFVVGDPQQSIYLFRGARAEVFAHKQEEMAQRGAELERLQINYRSAPELLYFFNDFFARQGKDFTAMLPDPKKVHQPERVVATFALASTPTQNQSAQDESEFAAIYYHVNQLLCAGTVPEDICILARTNRVLGEVADFLTTCGLPVFVHAAAGFQRRREVLDLFALLKFMINPHDDLGFFTLLRSPWYRCSDDALAQIASGAAGRSYWQTALAQVARETPAISPTLQRLRAILERCQTWGLSETMWHAVVHDGMIDTSYLLDPSGRREANIWKWLYQLAQAEQRPGFNGLDFVQQMQRDLDLEMSDDSDAVAAIEPNRINLMTVHAAKGLQFPHVFLPSLHKAARGTKAEGFLYDEERGVWCLPMVVDDSDSQAHCLVGHQWLDKIREREREEQKRLLYVALTRAKQSVFLSWQGKPEKNSIADQMSWDLNLGTLAEPHYQFTVDRGPWFVGQAQAFVQHQVEVKAPWQAIAESHSVQTFSVSELIERNAMPDPSAKAAKAKGLQRRLQSAHRGTLIHRVLEGLASMGTAGLKELLKFQFGEVNEETVAALQYVMSLNEPAVIDLMKNGHAEWGFLFREQDVTVEGQVDLWGRDQSGKVWVIDYKTGSPDDVEKAFQQMSLYALAIRKSGIQDDIHMAAVYPFHRELKTRVAPSEQEVIKRYLIGTNTHG